MTHDGSGNGITGYKRRRGIVAGRLRRVRAAVLSAPVAALLLVALLAVGAVDFLRRERTEQAVGTTQSGLVVDAEVKGSASATSDQERQLGAASGAVAALLVAAVALVVLLFAAVGLGVLLFAAALWAAMRSRRTVTDR